MLTDLNSASFLFELIGLQYFSLKTLSAKSNLNERVAIVRVIYMAVLMALVSVCVFVFTAINKDPWALKDATAKNVLMLTVKNSIGVLLIAGVFVSMIESLVSTKNFKKIFANTQKVDELATSEFKVSMDFGKIGRKAWRRFVTMTILFIFLHGAPMVASMQSPNRGIKLIVASTGAIPMFLLIMLLFRFVFFVDLVNQQLEVVNTILNKIRTEQERDAGKDSLKKLWLTKTIFNYITLNSELFNRSVGLTVLNSFVTSVITLTCSGYEIFIIAIGGYPREKICGESSSRFCVT
jgi:7tm Chemosensory receptor